MLLEKEENEYFIIVIKDNDIGDISKLLSFLDDNNIHCVWLSERPLNKQSIINKISEVTHLVNLHFYYIEEKRCFEVTYSNEIININERKKLGIINYYTIKDFLKGKNNHMFTKKDLKNGMVVETRDGKYYLVCGDKFIGFEGWLDSVDFNDFLECEPLNSSLEEKSLSDEFTIDKVYDEIHRLNDMEYGKSLRLLWERKIPKEMTVAEIEKELGYPIKIVKE